MLKNLKKKIAKVALVVLALQLAFLGLGSGAGKALAENSIAVGPTLVSVGAKIGGVDQTVVAGQNLVAYKGQTVVPNMLATLSEDNLSFVSGGDTGDITITGPLGGSQTNVTADYGTFTLLGNQAVITPLSGNAVLADDGVFTFTVAKGTIADAAGNTNDETNFNLVVTDSPAPVLTSVTAVLGGVSQTKLAGESLSAVVGQSVGAITATVSENSTLVSSLTEGKITISGGAIPAGTPYGTFTVAPTNHKTLLITPNSGNAALGQEGVFTFAVAPGQIQSVSGTMNAEATFQLTVGTNVLSAIGTITGAPQIGQVLTAGSLTPALATATYQWKESSTADGVYTDIAGATDKTYKLVASDLGKFVKVVATGTGDYIGSTATSAATTAVVAAPVAPAAVTGVTTLVDANGHVTISWVNPPVGTYSTLRIVRVGDFTVFLDLNATSYTDLTTERGETYQYVIIVGNEASIETAIPAVSVTVPASKPVVASAISDTTSQTPTSTSTKTTAEVKANATNDNAKSDSKSGFPLWGIILLIILALVGGYLIWNQKPTPQPIVAVEAKKKSTNTKKK